MGIDFWTTKKAKNLFSEFATKAFSEAIVVFLTAATSANLPIAGPILVAGAKGMMDKLLSKSSQIEKNIDKLLREPLLSGIRFLHDGILYPTRDKDTQAARDQLLHEAHVSLTKAWALVDSKEDSIFISVLDLISICAHSHHWRTADLPMARLKNDIQQQIDKVVLLETQVKEQSENLKALDRFLDRDSLRDKPIGHGEQRLFGKNVRKVATEFEKETNELREKVNILIDLCELAKRLLEVNKDQSSTLKS